MRAIYVHGGVSGTPKAPVPLGGAVHAGMRSGSAIDAIQAAVMALEDDPALNAGYGATLTRDGRIELDAGIAAGGHSGAVAGVRVRNPIVLARRVLEDTPHVLIASRGAIELGADLPVLEDTTPEQRETWERGNRSGALADEHYGDPDYVDTVGAVALDDSGRLAAGSSTGGVFGKLPGRVGDSPIFGAGFYASDLVAVVGTGVGELFIATQASFRVAHLVENGADPQTACEQIVGFIAARDPVAAAGLLALDRDGRAGMAFRGGSWSVEGPDGPVEATRLA